MEIELLQKMKRQRTVIIVILLLMLATLVATAVILVPRAIETMDAINAVTANYGGTLTKAELFFDGLTETDINALTLALQKLTGVVETLSGWFS